MRSRVRLALASVVGNKCWVCGFEGDSENKLMDMHHVLEKSFNLNVRSLSRSRRDVFDEVRKCALLCCMCHRKLHNDLLDSNEVETAYKKWWSTVNEEAAYRKFSLAAKPSLHTNTDGTSEWSPSTAGNCIDCGAEIWHTSTRCRKCYGKSLEKIDWPKDNVLIDMLRNSTQTGVAEKLGVSTTALRKRAKKIMAG